MKDVSRRGFLGAVGAAALAGAACRSGGKPPVVVYVSLDEMYSRPILEAWGARSGLEVKVVYDVEASKTTGLVNRLIAEQDRPRCDVFWNNETAQTIRLKRQGALAPYASPSAAAIPAGFKDPEGYWCGFAARARVIIHHLELVPDPPRSINDLLKPEWSGKAAIANPLFGTTATQAAALFAAWAEEKARAFFLGLRRNRVAVLAGNATVRDLVARGEYHWGLTDTDDANGAVEDGLPARWLFPDQEEGGLGTLVIPNTVSLIAGGPNPEAGKALIDHLLSPEVEAGLAALRSIQIPLNPAVKTPAKVPTLAAIRPMKVNFVDVAERMEGVAKFIREEFLK